MSKNGNLREAKRAKNNEFYTRLEDIEKELRHYKEFFRGKVVLCNADDPRVSNFFRYFVNQFENLGLKKVIASCYKNQKVDLFSMGEVEKAVWIEYEGDKKLDFDRLEVNEFKGDGDFRSQEVIELLKEADVVVTNPPFSFFIPYIKQLVEYDKKFLVVGNMNAITYKEVFKLIKENKIWTGYNFNKTMEFQMTPKYKTDKSRVDKEGNVYGKVPAICWYTDIDTDKRHEDLILYKKYDPVEYPKYDNYDAINVNKTKEIPMDYDGVMGVPVTFLDKWNPEQFELIGSNRGVDQDPNGIYGRGSYLNGKETFKRLFIRRKIRDRNEKV